MKQSFSEIYKSVELNSHEITFNEYLNVVEALEWKNKSGILVESIENDTDLVYWVETVRTHNTDLKEWDVKDFTNLVTKTKEKAVATGKNALQIATSITQKFINGFSEIYKSLTNFAKKVITDPKQAVNELFTLLKDKVIFGAFKHLKQMVGSIPSTLDKMYNSYKSSYDETAQQVFGFIHGLVGGKEIDDPEELGKKIRENDLYLRKFQQFLNKNPKLKWGVGIGVAWMLYKIWTIMVFKGDFIFDFNLVTALEAFVGKLDITEIFGGPAGVELLTWFGLAYVPNMPSASWLDGDLAGMFGGWGNHILAGIVTLFYYIAKHKEELFQNKILRSFQLKVCAAGAETPEKSKELVSLGKNTGIYINKTVCKATGGSVTGGEETEIGGEETTKEKAVA